MLSCLDDAGIKQRILYGNDFVLAKRNSLRQESIDEGGLHNPSALQTPGLAGGDARYETPAAVVQY